MNAVLVESLLKDIRYGFTGSTKQNGVGYRIVRVTDIVDNGKINVDTLPFVDVKSEEANRYYLQKGDCVIARSGSVGKAHIYSSNEENIIFASYLIRLRFDESKILPAFFGAFTRSDLYWKQIEANKQGGVQQNINTDGLSRIKVPLPPLPIQKRIAAILEKADTAREKRRQTIDLAEKCLQSAFLEMFGDPVTNPKGWEVQELRKTISLLGGYAFKSSDFVEKGIPLIKIGTVNKGYFDLSTISFLPDSYANEYSRFVLEPGDFVINLTGTTGKDDYGNVLRLKNDFRHYLLNQRLAKISFDQSILTQEFLLFIFRHPKIKSSFIRFSRGIRQANISNEDILSTSIPLPPLPLQQKFAALVEKVEAMRTRQRASEQELENLFQSLMQKAFKGELVS